MDADRTIRLSRGGEVNSFIRISRYYLILVLTFLFITGCGGMFVRRLKSVPAANIFVSQGNTAYERLDYRGAWEAYRKAEALGLRSAVVSYRYDLLSEHLGIKEGNKKSAGYRPQTLLFLEEAYNKGKANRPVIFFYLAQVLQSRKGGGKEAIRLYAEAIQKFEENQYGQLNAGDREILARMYLALGFPVQAERLLVQAKISSPRYALASYALGKIYKEKGRHLKAVEEFESFLAIVPEDTEGHILLGESAMAAGDYDRAKRVFETALSLDSTKSDARKGHQRAIRAVARRDRIKGQAIKVTWEVGYDSKLRPLTLEEDSRNFRDNDVGPPSFGPRGNLVFTFGDGERFQIYTVSRDGMHFARRAASSSGFTEFFGSDGHFLVTNGTGPGRIIGDFDSQRGTFKKLHRGYCREPSYSRKGNALLCVALQGVHLVNLDSGKVSTLFQEPGIRHPRFSQEGQRIVMAQEDFLLWLSRTGQVLGRVRLPGGRAAASYPAFSPDGRWILSGENGLHLTHVISKNSVSLDHPELKGAGRPVFSPDGQSLVFGKNRRWYRLEFPRQIEEFFTVLRTKSLIQEKKFGTAARLMKNRIYQSRNRLTFQMLMARSLFGLEFYEKAEEAALQAAQMDKRNWQPVFLLGMIKAAKGNWDESIKLLDRAIELNPRQFEGYYERARIRVLQGHQDEAIEDYRFALRWIRNSPGKSDESAVMSLLDLYVSKNRLNDALLLLLDFGDRLSAKFLRKIFVHPLYGQVRADPRFKEVMAPPPGGADGPKASPKPLSLPPPRGTREKINEPVRRRTNLSDSLHNPRMYRFFGVSTVEKELGGGVFW